MMKITFAKVFLVLGMAFWLSPQAYAQKDKDNKYLRTNPKFVETFREAVSKPSLSTVRILCDDKDTALGIIVEADGWVLTKANDLHGKVSCKLKDGRQFDAKIVGIHKDHDLAMLKIEAKNLVPVEFMPSKSIDAGSWVVCAGIREEPVAIGVVSVSTRTVVNRGPTFTIDPTKAGFLGISMKEGDGGVKITVVEPNSPAEIAGLRAEDIIVSLGGKNITDLDVFRQEVAMNKPGDVVTLKIHRDGEDLRIRATLGKRPGNMTPRSDTQNNMGSELSSRRSGYPTILQHDSVVKPVDCGGPIVDLDGHVVGINICRAGRTESWAVPSEVVLNVLADLKSGKLAPPEHLVSQPKAEKKKRILNNAEEKTKAVETLLALMKQRLELSGDVARFKFVNKLAVEDFKRDREQLTNLLEVAAEDGLDESRARDFVIAQLAAARLLQKDLHAAWTKDEKSLSTSDIPDLKKTLRPKIDKVSIELMEAFATLQPYFKEAAVSQLLRRRSHEVLQGGPLSEDVRVRALDGWVP